MKINLSDPISQFAHILQSELFPRLEPVLGEISDRHALFIATCAMVPFSRYLPCGRWNRRPSKDRLAIARAFIAKSIFGYAHTRQLLHALRYDSSLRSLCGWKQSQQLPHESTFSRAFAEFAQSELPHFAHQCLIASLHSEQLVGHISRDSSAVEGREYFVTPVDKKKKKEPKPKGKSKPGAKKGQNRRMTQEARLALGTRIERQLQMTDPAAMLAEIPTGCDIGAKRSSKGNTMYWRGYKLHLDVADGGIPITALLTSASVHDSQVAIPMMHITSKRVTYLYDVMDSAYDAVAIRTASEKLNHRPIIQPHTKPKPKTQVPIRIKLPPEMEPAEKRRYRQRTTVERAYSRLKDEFGARTVRVRGPKKVFAHLMFGVLALTVDRLLKMHK
jgi:hypothetical protein